MRSFSNSSRKSKPFCAPAYCTTDIELIGPQRSASRTGRPSASEATKVEEKASPAPVRS